MKGCVSILDLLNRYLRLISMVFQPDWRMHINKQHLPILIYSNLNVHKHRMRITDLNPFQRIIEPLQRNIEPHNVEPPRRIIKPFYGINEALPGKQQLFKGKMSLFPVVGILSPLAG